jgi:hypothetical protein
MGVNHGVLCWANGCESRCAILVTYVWTMVRYDELELDNHSVLYYAETVIMNHGVLGLASA